MSKELATLGGGCFWCLEAVYHDMQGIDSAVSGYMGGAAPNPTYEQVCGGRTGHAEVVQLSYSPATLPFRDILEVFFAIHDPTTLNRQGNDVGTQYRSVIFYHSEQQRAVAEQFLRELTDSRVFPGDIVTELKPAETFYPAEDYHQNYLANNPNQPYCQIVVSPKLAKFRQKFASRRKAG